MSLLNLPTRLKLAAERRSHYFEEIPAGHTLEQVMTYAYWVHVAPRLQINDMVEVVAMDGSYEATMRVLMLDLAAGQIKFRLLSKWQGEAGSIPQPIRKKAADAYS